jgi:hypothetical protein
MVVPNIPSVMDTICGELYVPAAGEKTSVAMPVDVVMVQAPEAL